MASTEAPPVSIEEALALAIGLHRQGEAADAETLYRRILAIAPAHPDARARLPLGLLAAIGPIRAQNDFLRAASALLLGFGAGALRLLPVARLYLARPLAVNPAPAFTDCFSPRPTDRLTDLAITPPTTSSAPVLDQNMRLYA